MGSNLGIPRYLRMLRYLVPGPRLDLMDQQLTPPMLELALAWVVVWRSAGWMRIVRLEIGR